MVAYNTASSAALPELSQRLAVPVTGVVEPAVVHVSGQGGRVGLLGTSATVESMAYQQQLETAGREVWAKACPLFVPIVEEGLFEDRVAHLVATHYLQEAPGDLRSLILGCTHYPFLKGVVARVLPGVTLIDSSEVTALVVVELLGARGLLNLGGEGWVHHYVTGDPHTYRVLAARPWAPVEEVERVELGRL